MVHASKGRMQRQHKDSHANSVIFQEKETYCMRKHGPTLIFPCFEDNCGLQAANTVTEQNKNQSQALQTEIRMHLFVL